MTDLTPANDAASANDDAHDRRGPSSTAAPTPLGAARVGFRGHVHAIVVSDTSAGLPVLELETRLLELGFLEGAPVEILHEGAFGGDPIAVRIDNTTIALRRREAMAILVESATP